MSILVNKNTKVKRTGNGLVRCCARRSLVLRAGGRSIGASIACLVGFQLAATANS